MNRWIELLVGLFILIGTILFTFHSGTFPNFWNFREAAWEFLKGGIVWAFVLFGMALILLGIKELKE